MAVGKTVIVAGIAALVAAGGMALAQGVQGDGTMRMGQGMGMDHGMGPGGGMGRGMMERGMGPGMMEPGMMSGRMGDRLCAAKDPIAPMIATRLETRLKPTDAQRADFDALKAAMTKAEQTLKAACPTEAERSDRTPPARLALAEKRMTAGLEALKTVRGPFDTFYAKLDDKQRDALRWSGRGDWGGWHRR